MNNIKKIFEVKRVNGIGGLEVWRTGGLACFKNQTSKAAFTLAEVLITLVIIGVVATMTIPSLINTIGKKVRDNQQTVFESKLQKGMDAMNLAGEVGPYYQKTEDFIKALSAHMKIVTICKSGELQNCFPYEEIQIAGEDKPLKVNEIENGKNFGLDKNDFKDVAGMVLADGTPMILSWNVNCPVSDPDSSSRAGALFGDGETVNTTNCIAGIYDVNGTRGPNRFDIESKTSDIMPYHMASLGSTTVANPFGDIFGGKRIVAVHLSGTYQPMTIEDICGTGVTASTECNAIGEAAALGIKQGYRAEDYWAGAVRECGGVDKLPTMQHLANLANALYAKDGVYNANIGEYDDGYAGSSSNGYIYQTDNEVATALSALGLEPEPKFYLWSGDEENKTGAWYRGFSPASPKCGPASRKQTYSAICLGD